MIQIEKIEDLAYNKLATLKMVEENEDLNEIFTDDVKITFPILYRLLSEDKLNQRVEELLFSIFDNIILTKKDLVYKYKQLTETQIMSDVVVQEPVVEQTVEPKEIGAEDDKVLPRRYGKMNIIKDIEKQGGRATSVQRAMLKVNELKNMYVKLSNRGIKHMIAGSDMLSDEDCRKITAAITTFNRQMSEILKNNSKKLAD